jgi:D-amino peptidase
MRNPQRFALVAIALAPLLGFVPASAQSGKKVYISVDMEGISGISGDDQLGAGGAEYGRSRKLMAEDANAAIRGAFAGGATDVLVNDSHGGQRNLLPEDLDPRARLISHSFKPYGMMQGLDDTFDAVLFVGYHAKASTPAGLFAHTGSGVVADVDVSGRSVGEGGLNTLLAGWYGVPVVMVTGDDVAVAEVRTVATSARGVVVKKALNVRAVELKPLATARAEIEKTAREAVGAASRMPPQRTGPYRVRMRFHDTLIPDIAEGLPAVTREAPDTVAWTSDTMPAAYRLVRVMYRYLNPN